MNKITKRLLMAGGLLFIGYQVLRMTRLMKAIISLDKALPQYLETVYGEAPKVGCSINAHFTVNTRIVVKYSAEILARHDDIEATVRQFIADFYPLLAKSRLQVELKEVSPQPLGE